MTAGSDPNGDDLVVSLADAADRTSVGGKAANLARLAKAGFSVPPGIVVRPAGTSDPRQIEPALVQALRRIPATSFAVRSSALAEDLASASFAGQYETELSVAPADVPAAVRRVLGSASSTRVRAYSEARAGAVGDVGRGIAVLVQAMVDADSAGVAFTADPVTGDRGSTVISAVRGLGERLVSGGAIPDEWVVRAGKAVRRSGSEKALKAEEARSIADLARRVEVEFGSPQDIEWAIADGKIFLLQARPMTALPDEVDWIPPFKAWWLRNLRLGEWLPEPVTPLFMDWLVPLLEEGQVRATAEDFGVAVHPASAAINGWYYTTPQGRSSLVALLGRLLRHPAALRRLFTLLVQIQRDPLKADPLLAQLTRRWRDERQPRYAEVVAAAERRVADASARELFQVIELVGRAAGEVFWSVESVAGSVWKIELALARFVRAHLARDLDGSYQQLLMGLPGTEPEPVGHAVESADWSRPTAGESGPIEVDPDVRVRHRRLAEQREAFEQRCRAALGHDQDLLQRFGRLLEMAQRYTVIREQQTRSLTIGWPVMRRAVLRLGDMAARAGAVDRREDVFFLTPSGLEGSVAEAASDLRSLVAERRARWERQRRLVAPLDIGSPPGLGRGPIVALVEAARRDEPHREGAIVGHPASPGRATGPVRIVDGPEQFGSFAKGDVLVARATAPAWTPLFARAAAVVTDGGSLAAHASLVAREFGIPAVVATGNATHRLRDGQMVTVDGSAGLVEEAHAVGT